MMRLGVTMIATHPAAAVKAAEEARLAKQNARSFGEIVDAYRFYMQFRREALRQSRLEDQLH